MFWLFKETLNFRQIRVLSSIWHVNLIFSSRLRQSETPIEKLVVYPSLLSVPSFRAHHLSDSDFQTEHARLFAAIVELFV